MRTKYFLAFLGLILVFPSFAQRNQVTDQVYKKFQTPVNEAKPRVWWHWMNGNITKEGIQKDLDWMERVGIGGFQNFDANLFTPVVVSQKLVFMTPEWKNAFRFTTELASQKGLEMAIAGSPGWSVTGGPWVKPEDAMKKMVWSETLVKGGQEFKGMLPKPSDETGKYQDAPLEAGGISGGFIGEKPNYYRDALVVAYRLPDLEKHLMDLKPAMTISGGEFEIGNMLDHNLGESFLIPPMEVGEDMWIQYSFEQPQTFKAMGISGASQSLLAEFNGAPENRSLKVSDDGVNFRTIAKVSGSTVPFNTVAFPATTAKYWRICYETLKPEANFFAAMAGLPAGEPKPEGVHVSEFVLFNTTRIDQVEDKAGFSPWKEDGILGTSSSLGTAEDIISSDQIVNLTDQMSPDGTISWIAPQGEWIILRLGYSLTGRQNHPASPEATGLEVDKLDKDAVRRYINHYLDLYQDATGGKLGPKGLEFMVLDSYEAGHMNWTPTFPQEFENRRGYKLDKYLPVITGRVVNNLEESEKFLWDFRKTIGELIAENHYDVIGEELKKRGMKRYTESHEGGRIYLADGMDVKRNADIPMSAMWTPGSLAGGADEEVRSEADIRESASVANIYGKPFVAAESMTSVGRPFQEYPERLKRTADLELASGLNRFVIHTSVHQPLDDKKPGFSLGPFGQYFTRQEIWAEQAKPWMDYLGRSSWMLQQGKNMADVLYYYGENTNITWVSRQKLPEIPKGFEFDFVNATALLQAIEAKNGKLQAISGNTYEVLMLDESAAWMTLPVLKKLKTLADAGVKIIGAQPKGSPSLGDNNQAFQQLATEIWSKENVGPEVKISTDADVLIQGTDHKILFRHRTSGEREIYWLNNRSIDPTEALVSFKVSGKVPKLWNPINGEVQDLSFEIRNGRTEIPLKFESWDAFFVVFEGDSKTNSLKIPEKKTSLAKAIEGDWDVDFNGKLSKFPGLSSWSEHPDAGIKYFSGTAAYKKTFTIDGVKNDADYILDLGEVKNIAEVTLNGKSLGIVWKAPFKVDITEALKNGENVLEIRVTNTWVNRLIGDAQPGAQKSTFTTMPFYQEGSQLVPSGLLGPVKLVQLK